MINWAGNLKQVTATDDYTVVFKFSKDSWANIYTLMDASTLNVIECPEQITDDSIGDWHYACGTGPYMLTDFANGSSITYSRNPNYWGYDERYPENQLPYIDTIKKLVIPDSATQQAAFRTGKIDMISGLGWQQGAALEENISDIQKDTTPSAGTVLNMKCDAEPFTDINVRIALQMSVDLETISDTLLAVLPTRLPAD